MTELVITLIVALGKQVLIDRGEGALLLCDLLLLLEHLGFFPVDGDSELKVLKLDLFILERLLNLCQIGDEFLVLVDEDLLLVGK